MSEPAAEFARAPLLDIVAHLRAALAGSAAAVSLQVLDPDHGRGSYAGEQVTVGSARYIHRPFRVWVELAERLGLRLLTPRPAAAPLIELRFERLDPATGWQKDAPADPTEKYGAASGFARISKLEEPGFLVDFAEALARVDLQPGARVLDLGVNTGDELALIGALAPGLGDQVSFVGVDHSRSALAVARQRFPGSRFHFVDADLGQLAGLDVGAFDLVVCIGTLQSPGIDDRELLRHIVQRRLLPGGSVILGFPNCRYVDGEVQQGTRMVNFREPELGLLIKDVAFYRKYLQQHHRQVHVTGSRYVLVTGVPAR